MNRKVLTAAKCQDPGDGSGDVIIDLPPEMLASMGVGIGDLLSVELVDGLIVLKKRAMPKGRHESWPDVRVFKVDVGSSPKEIPPKRDFEAEWGQNLALLSGRISRAG